MSELLFRSILTLSLGSLLALPFISVREIGRGFFTLWVGIVGSLGALGLGLRTSSAGDVGSLLGGGDPTATFLAVALVLLAVFWLALRFGAHRTATIVLIASALAGALVLRDLAVAPYDLNLRAGASGPGDPAGVAATTPDRESGIAAASGIVLRVSSLLLSALAVGMVTVAMVLGHWYLVQPKLAIAPLRRVCDVLIGVLLARLIVSGWGFAVSLGRGHAFLDGRDPVPWEIVILSQRLLFGFGGSLFLAVLIKRTVALRSTMSATGLLYIAILFVWVGEFLSIYLGRLTGGSLVV